MENHPVVLNLKGIAGQSFGVWNAGGLHLYLQGDANDYVGKGMAGGKIAIRPPAGSEFNTQDTSIVGNTCLYGATGGRFFAAGRAGERFAVRNSGVNAVVEGAGDHCCEYMTGGHVTILGDTGVNFGAGMTGGFAYVYDPKRRLAKRYNAELIDLHSFDSPKLATHVTHLQQILAEFVTETGSEWGQYLLDNFGMASNQFVLVKPKASSIDTLLTISVQEQVA